jgi:hypothetical protein
MKQPTTRTDKSRLGRRSKQKGKAFEKAVAEAVAEWLGLPIEDVTRARSGKDECDIGLSREALEKFPYWIECKNHKTLSIPSWLKQANEAVKRLNTKQTPIIVFKQHGDGTMYVCLDFFTFMKLSTESLVK